MFFYVLVFFSFLCFFEKQILVGVRMNMFDMIEYTDCWHDVCRHNHPLKGWLNRCDFEEAHLKIPAQRWIH